MAFKGPCLLGSSKQVSRNVASTHRQTGFSCAPELATLLATPLVIRDSYYENAQLDCSAFGRMGCWTAAEPGRISNLAPLLIGSRAPESGRAPGTPPNWPRQIPAHRSRITGLSLTNCQSRGTYHLSSTVRISTQVHLSPPNSTNI